MKASVAASIMAFATAATAQFAIPGSYFHQEKLY
jgi:hypothetical protein